MVTADNLSLARRALEARTLRFAFYDGVVGELCPEDAEDLWALNMKRGVLASFQNSMRQLDHEEHIREVREITVLKDYGINYKCIIKLCCYPSCILHNLLLNMLLSSTLTGFDKYSVSTFVNNVP